MKIMTLNTHSWLEPEPEKKLQELAEKILLEDYEVIALQEINQLLESEEADPAKLMKFCPVENQVPIRKDNFAYCLVQLLKERRRKCAACEKTIGKSGPHRLRISKERRLSDAQDLDWENKDR